LNDRRSRLILPFAIVIAILAVSTASIFVRFAQREAPSIVIAALRLGFAVMAIAPFAIIRYRSELRKLTRHELAVHFAAWITSLEYTSIVSSVVLVSTGPLWVALFSPLFLKEPLTRPVLIGMLLALLGGTVIALGDSCQISHGLVCPSFSGFLHGDALLGNFLALVGAWALAGYLMIGRSLRSGMSLLPYIFVVYGVAAVALFVAMFASGQSPTGFSGMTYAWIVLLALIPQLIGHDPALFTGHAGRNHHAGRTGWFGGTGLFHSEGNTCVPDNWWRAPYPGGYLCLNPEACAVKRNPSP